MASRKPEWLSRVKKQVWKKFPDLEEVEPSLSTRRLVRKGGGTGNGGECLHTLTFRKRVRLDDGARSTRIVRVVTDDKGR
ncbi:MAG: hypothetical protein H5T59_11465, partial [Anaerolineae bacterium]|nr:hypothetical protein [Anaerolineae bacterium]